ncbi:MAG: hypothetical protein JWR52_1077 [Marmoricola sp.]|nr:hypothetical protein [Marmoricola sp.]
MTSPDPATSSWQSMRRLVLELHDRRGAVSDAISMSYMRAKALSQLQPGPLTQRQLSARLMTDAPYTTVIVDDLEQRGLVQRQINPADRRSKLVSITEAGKEIADEAGRITSPPPDVFGVLSNAELRELARMLSLLVERSAQAPD